MKDETFHYDKNGKLISSWLFLDGMKHYVKYYYYPDGSKKIEQEMKFFSDLRKVGKYSKFFQNGNIHTKGIYNDDGKRMGEWKYFYPTGKIKGIENYNSEGDLVGERFEYYENGNIKESKNHNDNGVEVTIHYNEDGERLNGEYVDYDFSEFNSDSKKYIRNYSNGLLHGESITFNKLWNDDDYKIILQCTYIEGLLNGKCIIYSSYFKGIKSSEGFYVDGFQEGKWIDYGVTVNNKELFEFKLSEGNLKRGKLDGIWIYYYENGGEKEIKLWENGNFIKNL